VQIAEHQHGFRVGRLLDRLLKPGHCAGIRRAALDNEAARLSYARYLMRERGATASIMMPYSDHLKDFSRWYCQLWAESLGKSGMVSLPYPALGMVDQHSQLQFWLNGPPIGVYTLIDLPAAPTPPIRTADPDLHWMDGRTLGQLMKAASRATGETLARHGRPVRRLHLKSPSIDAETVGALAMHFLAETVLAGYMLGVDPYTQPAVDNGKALMREYLSNSGTD